MESLFTSQTPSNTNAHDGGQAIATSTRIKIAVDGKVYGVRWWATDGIDLDDTYIAELWALTATNAGTRVANKSLGPIGVGDVVPGWNVLLFDTPVDVLAGDVVAPAIVNYGNTTNGKYVLTGGFFNSGPLVNGNLRGLQTGETVAGHAYDNGCFTVYGARPPSPPTLPADTFNGGCYFVDLVFEASAAEAHDGDIALGVAATLATAGRKGVLSDPVDLAATATLATAGRKSNAGTATPAVAVTLAFAGRKGATGTSGLTVGATLAFGASAREQPARSVHLGRERSTITTGRAPASTITVGRDIE